LACAGGCFCVMAGCLRFGTVRRPLLDSLANNAFAIYLLHYVFVVWLQYALLGVALFAVAKGTLVFSGALLLAWATTAALRAIPFGSLLIGESPPPRVRPLSSVDDLTVPDDYKHAHRQLPSANLAR